MSTPDSTDLQLRATGNSTITVDITGVDGTSLNLSYTTMNGNQPNSFGNQVYLWQGGPDIPWNSPALESQAVTTNTTDGDMVFDGLDLTNMSYVVGYAVGPAISGTGKWTKYPNVVASVFLPAAGEEGVEPFSPSLVKKHIGTSSMSLAFKFLSGFNPQAAGAWAGVWVGSSPSYYNPHKWFSMISGSNSSGIVPFNNIQILRGTTYTVGLYPTGYATDPSNLNLHTLATTFTFTN